MPSFVQTFELSQTDLVESLKTADSFKVVGVTGDTLELHDVEWRKTELAASELHGQAFHTRRVTMRFLQTAGSACVAEIETSLAPYVWVLPAFLTIHTAILCAISLLGGTTNGWSVELFSSEVFVLELVALGVYLVSILWLFWRLVKAPKELRARLEQIAATACE